MGDMDEPVAPPAVEPPPLEPLPLGRVIGTDDVHYYYTDQSLHALEAAGYVTKEDRNVEGKVRKYYTITRAGEMALAAARARIRELVDEVLGST